MRYKTDRPLNKILVGDDKVLEIDVGSGWTITDIWFDHNVPAELIDCIKVKFEKVKAK